MKAMEMKPMEEDSDKKIGPYEDYEIECAVNTLLEAEEIKADAEKMKYVGPALQEKRDQVDKTITSLSDLKVKAKSRIKELAKEEA